MFNVEQFHNRLFKFVTKEINEAYKSLKGKKLEERGVSLQADILRVLQDVTQDAIINMSHGIVNNLRQKSKKLPFYDMKKGHKS